jgi:carbamoyltransferase
MTAILGISAYYHDSAAALIVDGKLVAAAQEERFTRKKHDAAFPSRAVEFCLKKAGMSAKDLQHVAFYDKPLLKFERLMETYFAFAPRGFPFFASSMPSYIRDKLFLRRRLKSALPQARSANFVFMEHHESHAASAFYPSPFQDAAVLTLDGVGEWATTSFGVGVGNKLNLTHQIDFPHSLGLLYSAVTYYCGFKVNSGEYKLMGLAPYGQPLYRDLILDKLICLRDDGSFALNMDCFSYGSELRMINQKFVELFGHPVRKPEERIQKFHADMAASIQAATEIAVLHIAKFIHKETGMKHLVMAGGVALNCVANGKLLREGPFEDIWVQPAAGDAGGALGAAYFVWHQLLEKPRTATGKDNQSGSLLGPEYSDQEIHELLQSQNLHHIQCTNEGELLEKVTELLNQQNVVGWFQGPMEFGPRALGARSILGDPRSQSMQSTMNLKIKYRESFRPFAPIVLKEHAHTWFEMDSRHSSPYMLMVAPIREEYRTHTDTPDDWEADDLMAKLHRQRSNVPAITHVDFSARLQTVGDEANPRLRKLLQHFYQKTQCPMLVNTSFNIRGEPIVCSPTDALRCFAATEMDFLVLGKSIVTKESKQAILAGQDRTHYINSFELD